MPLHIFPLSLDQHFASQGFTGINSTGADSPQNGMLLDSTVHQFWDSYSIAVNPNDGYRMQSFSPNVWELHGKVMDPVCRDPDNPLSVDGALLRWHYEQAVLCNVRRAGEPVLEFDFPPGTNMIEDIQQGPQPAQQMEAELFNRLYGWHERQTSNSD